MTVGFSNAQMVCSVFQLSSLHLLVPYLAKRTSHNCFCFVWICYVQDFLMVNTRSGVHTSIPNVDKESTSDLSRNLVVYTDFSHDASLLNDPSMSGMVDGVSSISDLPHTSLHVESPIFEKESDVVHDSVAVCDNKNANVEHSFTIEILADIAINVGDMFVDTNPISPRRPSVSSFGLIPLIILLVLSLMKPSLFLLMLL